MTYEEMNSIKKSNWELLIGKDITYTELGYLRLNSQNTDMELKVLDDFLCYILPCLNISTDTDIKFNTLGTSLE